VLQRAVTINYNSRMYNLQIQVHVGFICFAQQQSKAANALVKRREHVFPLFEVNLKKHGLAITARDRFNKTPFRRKFFRMNYLPQLLDTF
jgi:hypothetical protein